MPRSADLVTRRGQMGDGQEASGGRWCDERPLLLLLTSPCPRSWAVHRATAPDSGCSAPPARLSSSSFSSSSSSIRSPDFGPPRTAVKSAEQVRYTALNPHERTPLTICVTAASEVEVSTASHAEGSDRERADALRCTQMGIRGCWQRIINEAKQQQVRNGSNDIVALRPTYQEAVDELAGRLPQNSGELDWHSEHAGDVLINLLLADVAVLVDVGSVFWREHRSNVALARNETDANTAQVRINQADVETIERHIAELERLTPPTRQLHIFFIVDGDNRPEAKRQEIRRRNRQQRRARKKEGKMKCGEYRDYFKVNNGVDAFISVRPPRAAACDKG